MKGTELEQAQQAQLKGELEQADQLYQSYCRAQPEDLAAKHQWAIVKLQRQQLTEALAIINELLQAHKDQLEYSITKAKILVEQKDYQAAEAIYQSLLEKQADYIPLYMHLGALYFHSDQLSKAQMQYKTALQMKDHPEIRFNYALALAKDQQLNAAKKQLKQVICQQPQHLKAHFQLAEIYRQEQDLALAIKHYLTVIEHLPAHVDANLGIAYCYDQQGKQDKALYHLQPFLDYPEPILEIHEFLAKIYTQQAAHQKAIKHYQTCLSIETNINYFYNLAVIYMDMQRHAEAINYFKEVLSKEPKHLATLMNLGSIYLSTRNQSAAIEAYERAWELSDDKAQIEHILSALKQETPAAKPPTDFVANLFNNYAPRYDEHLTNYLKYKVPEQINTMLEHSTVLDQAPLLVVDAGCGTGLSAPLIKPYCKHLIGIDLAADMLRLAAEKKLYDELIEDDLCHALENLEQQDLVIAADVLSYFGDLQPPFAAAAHCLKQGGYFIFSVEKCSNDPRYKLRKTLRYAHHSDYIKEAAEQTKFELCDINNSVIREDHGRAIEGYIVLLKKHG